MLQFLIQGLKIEINIPGKSFHIIIIVSIFVINFIDDTDIYNLELIFSLVAYKPVVSLLHAGFLVVGSCYICIQVLASFL